VQGSRHERESADALRQPEDRAQGQLRMAAGELSESAAKSIAPVRSSRTISGPLRPLDRRPENSTLIAPPEAFGRRSVQNGRSRDLCRVDWSLDAITLICVGGSPWARAATGARSAAMTVDARNRLLIGRLPRRELF